MDQPTYCLVVLPITFQDNNPTLSLTTSSVGGDGPSTPASSGSAQATPELTKNETANPKSATPTALEVSHFSLNRTLTTGLDVQELTSNTDSDITLAGSFGANDEDLTYLELTKNSPEIKNTSSDLSALIKATGNIHEVVQEDIEELHTPRVIFNQENKLDPAELLEEEANQTETPLDNGGTPPLLNQSPSQY